MMAPSPWTGALGEYRRRGYGLPHGADRKGGRLVRGADRWLVSRTAVGERLGGAGALLEGKTCVITGANRGIGREAAAALLGLGARVVLVCRDQGRGDAAQRELRDRTGREPELVVADLAVQHSLRAAADGLARRHERLDLLIHNAATIPATRSVTVDGVETQFAVNHLAGFFLTHLLLPLLRAAPAARVIVVSSNAHRRGRLDFQDLQAERSYRKQRRYSTTKLANVLFTYALARRLGSGPVTVNAVRPGTINTGLVGDFLRPFGFLRWLFVASTPARGAAPIVRLASDAALAGVTGQYFDRFRVAPSSPTSLDLALQERLWEASARLTGLA